MIDNSDNRTDNVTGTELMYQNLQFAQNPNFIGSGWLKNYESILKPLFES